MKKRFSIILFFVSINILNAQDKTVKLDSDNIDYIQAMDLGDIGLIIKTGLNKVNSKNLEWVVSYYSPDLDQIWSVPIEKTQIEKGFSNPMVISTTGSYFYQLEYQGYNTSFGAKKVNVTQVNKLGQKKNDLWEDENAENVISSDMMLCNDEVLAFIDRESGKGGAKNALLNDKIVIHSYSNDNFTYKKYEADLPVIKDIDNSSFWQYLAHGDDIIYFSYRTMLKKEEKMYFFVAAVDYKGVAVNDFKIDASLKGMNYRAGMANRTDGSVTGRAPIQSGLEKFGDIIADLDNNAIYIYGISGEKPPKKSGSKYEGYFIQKYNLQGDNEWKIQRKVPEQLEKVGFFRIHGTLYDRYMALTPTYDKGVNFQIFFKDQLYSFKFNSNGDYVAWNYNEMSVGSTQRDLNTDCGVLNLNFNVKKERSNVIPYFVSLDSKAAQKNTYRYYRSSQGEILIEYAAAGNYYNLLFFEN